VTGNWRDFVAIADMNEDGNPDIIAPPQRGVVNVPAIFLGDGKGGWKQWTDVKWPATFNYGSAAAADLDGDGHQDLAFGSHMMGIFAMLGDGKGNFRSFDEGLPKDYATRRVRIADVNGDGRPDLIALCEGPVRLQQLTGKAQPKLRVFLNQKTKWTEMPLVGPEERQLGDRWLEVTDLNGDGKPDFVASSNILSGTDLMYISDKKGWTHFGRGFLPWYSTYSALVAGHFTSKKKSDAILGFSRTFSREVDPDKVAWPANLDISGIERLSWARDGKVTRVPIARWPGAESPGAMAAADLDGDGNLDIIYFAERSKGFIVLLGDGKGGFRSARIEGLPNIDNLPIDVEVADVNKDGRPDLIIVYQEHSSRGDSSIRVFLNDGVR
jgi:FG-GAP-like repeat